MLQESKRGEGVGGVWYVTASHPRFESQRCESTMHCNFAGKDMSLDFARTQADARRAQSMIDSAKGIEGRKIDRVA